MNKATGKAIAKIPVISKSQIDETLIENSERIGAYRERMVQSGMSRLLDRQSSCVRPFIDNINTIMRLYNEPVTLMFDNETLYFGSETDRI